MNQFSDRRGLPTKRGPREGKERGKGRGGIVLSHSMAVYCILHLAIDQISTTFSPHEDNHEHGSKTWDESLSNVI